MTPGAAADVPDEGTLHKHFESVAGELTRFARDLGVRDADVVELRAHLREGRPVPHDRAAEAFAAAYLGLNFWKVAAALQAVRPRAAADVLDLGAGSGAAAAAALAYIDAHAERAPAVVRLTLVDASAAQLRLARRLVLSLGPVLRAVRVETEAVRRPLAAFLGRGAPVADLVLAGHVLTENARDADALLGGIRDATLAEGVALIVERPDDPVWRTLTPALEAGAVPRSEGSGRVSAPEQRPARWNGAGGYRWAALRQPRQPWLARLVRDYFACWATRSTAALARVFTTDATYAHHPFQEPLEGLPAIEAYWRTQVETQSDVRPRLLAVGYDDDRALVEWETCFTRDGRDRLLRGAMTLEADPDRGLVRHLREYYDSTAAPVG